MDANKIHKPETHWDQTAFEEMRATWSPERMAEDEKTLKEIFALAAACPLLAEALDWAKQHDVKFFVDRTVVSSRGYYTNGTGVLGIAEKIAADPEKAAKTVVHEIRHAWQNYNGLSRASTSGFSEHFIMQALIEADAKAFGMRAGDQIKAALLKKQGEPVPADLQKSLADENADLGRKFLIWFGPSGWTETYGDSSSKRYGQRYDLFPVDNTKPDKGLPERRYEFTPKNITFRRKYINVNDMQDVLRLGVNFSGTKNYLAALQPDILPKQILRPSLADTFWGAANDDQKKLTGEIRKAYLKKKLAPENKKKPHPWP